MICKYTPNDIGRYLFNKMNQEEEAEFQLHLSQCEKCRTDLQAIRNLAEGLKADDTPDEIYDSPSTTKNKSLRNYFIAASILLLCCLGMALYYFSIRQPDTRQGLSPDTYLYQDSIDHAKDTLLPIKKKDSQ